jgi:hypothetical protein
VTAIILAEATARLKLFYLTATWQLCKLLELKILLYLLIPNLETLCSDMSIKVGSIMLTFRLMSVSDEKLQISM